jgi:hypothetical protein
MFTTYPVHVFVVSAVPFSVELFHTRFAARLSAVSGFSSTVEVGEVFGFVAETALLHQAALLSFA